jgi:hypothetical protein
MFSKKDKTINPDTPYDNANTDECFNVRIANATIKNITMKKLV